MTGVWKLNKTRTCYSNYCFIHKTRLRQTGNDYEMKCPICEQLYAPAPPKPPDLSTPEKRQKLIDRYPYNTWTGGA